MANKYCVLVKSYKSGMLFWKKYGKQREEGCFATAKEATIKARRLTHKNKDRAGIIAYPAGHLWSLCSNGRCTGDD